ncbi:MAG: MMPL family transporter [Lachnospiraceae bacterium]|jgi:predicted RND superfamily exporter protein|nr:MMPL family transporter [Lachnospiraceae bacterium]MCI1397388.1 MMPL family transporter [Lachnospiraceae bacterium]MCI1423135.1 MMPL family transporter [Lachnospiraceae bacterium]MCI1451965.1 MMPL family transporter [Lachnospiraceae bacterium]
MNKLGKKIVKLRIPILIIATILLIPALIGYKATKVNYDMLVYLPQDIDTMKGQDILKDEFGTGAFAPLEVEGMTDRQVADLEEKIKQVPHVKDVIWYDTVLNLSVPKEILPQKMYDAFNSGDATLLFLIFDDTTSEDGTVRAVQQIRKICNEQCFLGGMTAGLVDTQELSDKEAPIYIGIAVLLTIIVLSLAMDSYLVPFIFLLSIGYAVLYNMGTNLFLGKISYITKSIAAVLQLGVTMDYSIFLWHSYEHYLTVEKDKETAMAKAVNDTFSSIIGSSVTTIAGFIALCFMSFKLGLDMGLVMAKGVLFGVVCCITVLPSMVLFLDKPLQKTRHRKTILPEFHGIGKFVTKHYKVFFALFWIILIPALYGYNHTSVYYQLDRSLPADLPSVIAVNKIEDTFNMNTTDVLMVDSSVPTKDIQSMANEMENVDGVNFVLGFNTIKGPAIPDALISDNLKSDLINDHWQLLLIQSEYHVASDEVNAQCDELSSIAKKYDPNAMLIGEAPATKDLITITNHDFGVVNSVSIGVIFVIILLVFKSVSLPIILVCVIEFGIFINLGIPCYTGTVLPFVASIIIGTIQLGSTVDYAILMTTRYLRERTAGAEKIDAVRTALQTSVKSIVVSALTFFAATFGVGLYSDIDIVSSMCVLMSRGALISMMCVLFVLPSFLMIFDKWIIKTTKKPKLV